MNFWGYLISSGDPTDRWEDGTLKTYMGPTKWDADPGMEWHYGCDGWVISAEDGQICMQCEESAEWPAVALDEHIELTPDQVARAAELGAKLRPDRPDV